MSFVLRFAFLGLPVMASAQALPRDTVRADTARRLRPVTVSVTRSADTTASPWSTGMLSGAAWRRGRAGVGIDEALPAMAGVLVQNRYNYSVDQRLAVRGAGSRANFGVRGLKVLLDGIPQSLPDGQSQLGNVDLASVGAVEVLRGSASSLYGNGSGGVLSFHTDLSSAGAVGASLRTLAGSAGLRRAEARVSGRMARAVGAVSASRTTLDGARQYSAADVRQLNAGTDVALSDAVTASLRFAINETPTANNPGALTAAEYARNPDSAAASNVLRGARRAIAQRQLSLRLHGTARGDLTWSAAVYGIRRFVDNPLATPPPGGGALNGTYSSIDRRVTGARFDATWRGGTLPGAPSASAGFDVQRSFDVRRNWRDTRGVVSLPSDTLLLAQGEEVVSVGPFAQFAWSPLGAARPRLTAGVRHDRLRFSVADHFLGDRADNSGRRTMAASSVQAGMSWPVAARWTIRMNASTAFETPTTTELNARADGAGGFNATLQPQRVRSLETGAHWRPTTTITIDATAFEARARDAIVQFLAVDGRSFFRNAGGTRTRGVELSQDWAIGRGFALSQAVTVMQARFMTYRVVRGAVTDTLDGHRLAGMPDLFGRFGARWTRRQLMLAADYTMSGALFADDANRQRVAGWGTLDVRAAWRTTVGGIDIEPLGGVSNLLDRRYVGAVTINGAGGRTLEPAPGRQAYVGVGLRHP